MWNTASRKFRRSQGFDRGWTGYEVELIQSLIPLGLKHVEEVLQAEVAALAGGRYSRGSEPKQYVRWGRQSALPLV